MAEQHNKDFIVRCKLYCTAWFYMKAKNQAEAEKRVEALEEKNGMFPKIRTAFRQNRTVWILDDYEIEEIPTDAEEKDV